MNIALKSSLKKTIQAIGFVTVTGLFASVMATETPKVEQTTFQDWTMVCVPQQESETQQKRCHLLQTLSVQKQEQSQRILQATVVRQGEQRILEILVPLGIDLRPGLLIQVDEGAVGSTPYLTCNANGCIAIIDMDDSLWRQLRAGQNVKIGIRGLGQPENTVLQLSLKGFTAAGDALMAK